MRLEASYRGSGLGGAQLLRTGGFPGVVTGTLNSGFGGVLGQSFGPDYPTWSLGVTVSHTLGRSYEPSVRCRRRWSGGRPRPRSPAYSSISRRRFASRRARCGAPPSARMRRGPVRRWRKQRPDAEQRRYGVGLSTSFLVTQAQRDLLQAEVNRLQATLDYQSSLVNFEALQLAPALSAGAAVVVDGAAVQPVPTAAPRGVFRAGVPQ